RSTPRFVVPTLRSLVALTLHREHHDGAKLGGSNDAEHEDLGPGRSGQLKRDRAHRGLDPHGRDDGAGDRRALPAGRSPRLRCLLVPGDNGPERLRAGWLAPRSNGGPPCPDWHREHLTEPTPLLGP